MMKRFISLVLAMMVVMSLTIPSFAASNTSASGTTTANKYYIIDNGEFSGVPIQIYGFTSSAKTVIVKIGESIFTGTATHAKYSSSWTNTTIQIHAARKDLKFGFGGPHDVTKGFIDIEISIGHASSYVPTQNLTLKGTYSMKSLSTVTMPSSSLVMMVPIHVNNSVSFHTVSGDRNCTVRVTGTAYDDDTTMHLSRYMVQLILSNDSLHSHDIVSGHGLRLNGRYQRTR